MEELKRRGAIIADIANFSLPQAIAVELCYLQLRMICELIALGCLAAHGDIPATQSGKMRKEYRPGTILTELERLHPDFYPAPGRQILGADGIPIIIERLTDPYLTKSDLLSLWSECGKILHRGSIKDVDRPFIVDLVQIGEWDQKILKLLGHHKIQLCDGRYQLWVIMQGRHDGHVSATLMEKTLASA
jgi:hypothetical protein